MTHLFLSPHLDDAVLSAAGIMQELRRRGENVLVATVMAGWPAGIDSPLLGRSDGYAARLSEDEEACRRLGVAFVHGGVYEAAFRRFQTEFLYPDWNALFGSPHPLDGVAADIRSFLRTLPEPTALYAPAGLGHVDHRLVASCARELTHERKVLYYADFPYCLHTEMPPGYHPGPSHVLTASGATAKANALAAYESQLAMVFRTNLTEGNLARALEGSPERLYTWGTP